MNEKRRGGGDMETRKYVTKRVEGEGIYKANRRKQ